MLLDVMEQKLYRAGFMSSVLLIGKRSTENYLEVSSNDKPYVIGMTETSFSQDILKMRKKI